ncbi:DegT/DnrJ/EryC1/StrS family aminotransferase [Aristophania vespae]|uniref:DegT/DnrJ/EryC1/StrS family aminotransferase n=1 Tax=Aristophania vespae TaxID=2697033 RepID=UPI002351275D|nr:DegT/DnrJ/EryC1/StrS family aminotransferase [Aristophania vespae]UMM64689.1 UDP-2-acetamido-2-deoxy-3-oxo-D-glucuronate aminotransferase [Aristophania vespae]
MSGSVPFLNLSAQRTRINSLLKPRLDRVFEHCQFVLGPEVQEFEQRLSHYCHARHAIAVSSGTDALLAVLMGEDIGPDMAVFLPSFTYTATAEVVLLLGATPIFVDVDPETFQIDIASLKKRYDTVLSLKKLVPKVIIAVDLFGQPAPWDELKEFAASRKLTLIADCAQSFGAVYKNRKLGCEALATTLSFFPSKPLGGYGDGGAILTNDDEKAALYRSLRSHGEGKERYNVQRIGLNARLDTLQAAILLTKLDVFEQELQKREEIARYYDKHLPLNITPPQRVPYSKSAWAIYCVTLESRVKRDSLRQTLTDNNIGSAIYYPKPLHFQPAYKKYHDGTALPVSESKGGYVLALPIYPDLKDDERSQVIKVIKKWAKDNS